MGAKFAPIVRRVQPPGHAKPAQIPGLVGLLQCSGQAVDLCTNLRASIGSAGTLSAQPQGYARNASGATAAIYTARRGWPTWELGQPLTMLAYFELDSTLAATQKMIGQTGSGGYCLAAYLGSNRGYGTNGSIQITTGSAWPLGTPISAAVTWDGTNVEGWCNGVSDGTAAGTTPTYGTFSSFTAGGSPDGGSQMNGRTWYVALFNRVLSDVEIQYFYQNPFAVYDSDSPPIWLNGAASPDVTLALTGVAGTGAVGTLTPSTTVPVTGVAGTGAVGTVGVSHTQALTGIAGTGAAGTVTPGTTVGLTGVAGTGAVGTVSTGGDVTVSVTGVAATGAVGTVGVSHTQAITGVAGTGAVGTVTPSTTVGITGVSGTGAVGTVGVIVGGDITVAITGVSATGQVGNVTASGGDVAAVTGGAGPGGSKRRRRILVRIDGENFEVGSDAEAVALLEAAAESAQQTAKAAAVKVVAKAKPKATPKALPVPKMALVEPDYSDPFVQQVQAQVDAARARISDTYKQALDAAIEARRRQQDDEEVLMLLLH